MLKWGFSLLLTVCTALSFVRAQPRYPQGLFRNPLRIQILLAGNFGECRPGHFHSGIDIKTGGKEGEPVYAAADGYISRIKMEPGGFGHALYITHPNGYTTLYAHLNDFMPPVQRFMRAAQYRRESWELDTVLPVGLFPVRQGDQIAWSGNTGGSTAPHLHFEIRDTKTEHPLNPQLFGLPIRDARPPVLKALYLYDLTRSVYVQTPRRVSLRQTDGHYAPASGDTLLFPSDQAGIGLVMDDYADGSENTLAPCTISWQANGITEGTITLDDIGYEETRYLHAYADYRTKWNGGPWVQDLFRLPGNGLTHIYDFSGVGNGAVQTGGRTVPLEIVVRDAAGNESALAFWLKRGSAPTTDNCARRWKPLTKSEYSDANLRLTGGEGTLYDTICLQPQQVPSSDGFSDRYLIGSPEIPLHTALRVELKPNRPVPFSLRSKLAIVVDDGKSKTGYATTLDAGEWYRADIRSFGDFRLVADTTAPRIGPVQKIAGGLRYTIGDFTTRVGAVRGEIDGHWVPFEQHGNNWTYKFDDRCLPGRHSLVLTATDVMGNRTRTTLLFNRS